MKKIIIGLFMGIMLLGITGCGCGRVENKDSEFYKKELSFDYKSMGTISVDIKDALEKGLDDASPVEMKNGHFSIERPNYSYNYGEGTTKTSVNFYEFIVDARADEQRALINAKGIIKIDFESIVDGSEYGGNYTIKNKNHKEIEFEVDGSGKTIYDSETGNFTIIIPEFKEKGTINQVGQSITIYGNGSEDVADPKTNTWDIDETWDNVEITFAPHSK